MRMQTISFLGMCMDTLRNACVECILRTSSSFPKLDIPSFHQKLPCSRVHTSDGEAGDAGADRLDNAAALVAENDREAGRVRALGRHARRVVAGLCVRG